ncbi:MAG TPA: hypothetical protein VFC46_00510, partial [Humisphaera sp.]|nr:hypothetical protein [Humisphaera sp.]
IRPTLFFRDVGVHNDAPHSIAIDKAGHCHLIIADGNNFRKDRFDLYWMIGNPVSGKWENAFLIDGRDFISSPRPLVIASGDDIHLLWNRQASRNEDQATESGLFYVERVGNHFGRKVRLISGEVRSWDAAIDLRSGRVVAAISRGDGVYVASLVHHRWTRPTKLPVFEARETDVVVTAASGGFLINTRLEQRDYLLLPK